MMKKIPAIVSVHDVMPSTFSNVQFLLETKLKQLRPEHILLLVVPGLEWNDAQIAQLKRWQRQGYELAGHGWVHQAKTISTWYHKLHSLLISRTAAEHLSLTESELVSLLKKNIDWFKQHEFELPQYYVPPAWALGRISREALREFPFLGIESTTGIELIQESKRRRLPLVGFEADTPCRAAFLRIWNRYNTYIAKTLRPVRISIHPYDHELLISDQLSFFLDRAETQHWRSVFEDVPAFLELDESHNNTP